MYFRIFLAVTLVVFFLSCTWLFVGLPVIFNSPDESANFLFASEMRRENDLVLQDPANLALNGLIHPRSVTAIGDRLLPSSFLGLPVLSGVVGIFTGEWSMFFVTPLLAVFAVVAWGRFIYGLFQDRQLAMLSAFLLAIHPGFWYYSGRVMMHNIGFVAFLIFCVWAAGEAIFHKKKLSYWFASGIFFGFAVVFRSSEIIWLGPLMIMLFAWIWRQIDWRSLMLFFVGIILVFLPFAMFNYSLYGSVFATGYTVEIPAIEIVTPGESVEAADIQNSTPLQRVMSYVLPFGFAERAILRHVWQYGFALYPWMSLFVVVGWFYLLLARVMPSIQKKYVDLLEAHERWLKFFVVTLVLSTWLAVLYGSWVFHDNPDPNIFSLGNSYVRYWLPLFVLASPFTALGVLSLSNWFSRRFRFGLTGVLCLVLLILSARLVWFGDDGFVHTRRALVSFDYKKSAIIAATEDDAIVIVDRADKFLFPARRVVVPLRDESTYTAMPTMIEIAPLYYFGITLPEEDMRHLNEVKLAELGLRIDQVKTINDETLYRISWNE